LIPGAVLKLDAEPPTLIELDDVRPAPRDRLLSMADATFDAADLVVLAGSAARNSA
jgi:hypothetical protein